MPRATPLQPSFNAGEFSLRMLARTDFQKYPLACEVLENMLPLPQGGTTRRPGSVFVAEVKDSAKGTVLLPFEFSTEQAYAIEAGAGYFRFFRNQGQIVIPDTDAAIANGTFASDITGWTDQSTGTASIVHDATNEDMDLVGASASIAIAEQQITIDAGFQNVEHALKVEVKGVAGDRVRLRIGTTSGGTDIVNDDCLDVGHHVVAFTPGAATFFVQFRNEAAKTVSVDNVLFIDDAPVEVATPYLESELPALITAQSADVMYICHESHRVHKLLRFSNTTWSLVEVDFIDGPYLDENPDDTLTLQPSAVTGLGITISANSAAGINEGDGFLATDVGRLVRIKHADNWGYAVITGVTSATQVTADVKRDFGATTAQAAWRLGSWSVTTGFPRALAFFEQRLVLAGSTSEPQSKWYSQSDDFESHEPDSVPNGGGVRQIEDDDALTYTIAADQVNAIRWLKPLKELVIGTVGGEWVVQSDGPLITPTDIDVKRRTAFGSADNVLPVLPRGRLMFLQRARRKILEFTFSFELDNFQALDQTLLADHVSKGGLIEMAYQQELDSVIWCVRSDGQMPTLTFQPEQQVIGWARQILGGAFAGGGAVVEDVVIVPALTRDEVWTVVKRTINGVTRRYVEFFAEAHEPGDDAAGACYVDSAIRGTFDPKVTTVTGLDHLEGETISLLVDGAVHPPKTVNGGQVTLDFAGGKIVAGLQYRHRFKGLKIEAGSATGTAQGQIKRIESVNLVLLESMNGAIGSSFGNLQPLFFRKVDDPMDTAVPLFTGEKVVEFGGDFESDPRIHLEGDAPGPFTLLALVPSVKTNKT